MRQAPRSRLAPAGRRDEGRRGPPWRTDTDSARNGAVAGSWIRGSQRPSWSRRSAARLPSTRQAARRMARPPPHAYLIIPREADQADQLSCQRAESSGERSVCGVSGQGDPGTRAQGRLQAAGTCLQVCCEVCCLSDSGPGNPPAAEGRAPGTAGGSREGDGTVMNHPSLRSFLPHSCPTAVERNC